ncbi:hypothetical protein ES703_39795 [subsurface metagenome]
MCALQILQLQDQVADIAGFSVTFLRLDFVMRNSATANINITENKTIKIKTAIEYTHPSHMVGTLIIGRFAILSMHRRADPLRPSRSARQRKRV